MRVLVVEDELKLAKLVRVALREEGMAADVAVRGYDLKINGGETGPGGVTEHCVCENTNAMRTQAPAAQVAFFRALTAESELTDYTNVTPSSIPATTSLSQCAWRYVRLHIISSTHVTPSTHTYQRRRSRPRVTARVVATAV